VSAPSFSWVRLNVAVALAALLWACVYVGQAWSPSSYGHVLKSSGATDTGLVWGVPRAIRSDEWSVTTPLTQAAVRNNFERFNKTSYYEEDLRSNYALPLNDWALIFKPGFWLFDWVPPAYAFSWHYWLMGVLFIFGYAHFFRMAGASEVHAFGFSLGLYFSGFVQFFWNSNTALLALFPWLIVVMGASWRMPLKVLLFYWFATSWLIGNFYPPLFISLAWIGLFFLWAYRPDLLKPKQFFIYLLATLAACGTAIFYLWDYLALTASTTYPGQRFSLSGYYPWHLFLTHFWPSVLFDVDFNPGVDYTNVTGVGVVGLYWTLAALCFTHWSMDGLRRLVFDRTLRILFLGLAITMAWMLAPVPAWIGKLTLLNRVPPERMVYAAGLMVFLCVLHVFLKLGMTHRAWLIRFIVYLILVIGGWLSYGLWSQPISSASDHLTELLGPLCIGLSLWAAHRWRWNGETALVVACTAVNVLVLGRFNPIQSAKPLFEEPQHLLAQTLRSHVNAQGVLPVQKQELIGATLNGMGFRAVAHLNVTPQWSVWRRTLGPMDESQTLLFNRYAHIRLSPSEVPVLLENDQVGVPSSLFRARLAVSFSTLVPQGVLKQDGLIERVEKKDGSLVFSGWAQWSGRDTQRELRVVDRSGAHEKMQVSLVDLERWDRVFASQSADHLLSGFVLTITAPHPNWSHENLCVYSRTIPEADWTRLVTPWGANACNGNSHAN
jgi:hypothetical protein